MIKLSDIDDKKPLFLQVKSKIIDLLSKMNFQAGDKIPSENVLCRGSDVSIRTVRRALAELEKDGVIIRRQGQGSFLVNLNAKNEAKSLGAIGIMFSDMSYMMRPVFSELLQAIEANVLERGYSFHLYSTGNRLDEREKRPLEKIVPLENVQGLIASSALSNVDIQTIRRNKIPIVTFNEYKNIQLNSVIFDYYKAAVVGIEYLWKSGCRKIAFICRHFSINRNQAIFNNDNFLRGIKDVYSENGMALDMNLIFESNSDRKEGRDIIAGLLGKGSKPDAVFTVDDFLAAGVREALNDLNANCKVISCGIPFDNEIFCVYMPTKKWGKTAVDLLMRTITGDSSIRKTKYITPELINFKLT